MTTLTLAPVGTDLGTPEEVLDLLIPVKPHFGSVSSTGLVVGEASQEEWDEALSEMTARQVLAYQSYHEAVA